MTSSPPRIKVLHLYDQYLNIYADRGNIMVLTQRCAWRGIGCEVTGLSPGQTFVTGEYDLIYVGGGQDRDQRMIAERMSTDLSEPIHAAVEEGTALLAVCGGYQLLGTGYADASGAQQPGVGLFDASTTAGSSRLIGNVALECTLPRIAERPELTTTVAGFENHAGRTTLGANARALGRVLHGHGNNGESGDEGCRQLHAIGTYLHGPLLPRNPELADWLIAAALAHAGGERAVRALDTAVDERVDAIAAQARAVVVQRASHG